MICPRCSATIASEPIYIHGRKNRRKAALITCGSCSAGFDAYKYYGSARDAAFTNGAWRFAA